MPSQKIGVGLLAAVERRRRRRTGQVSVMAGAWVCRFYIMSTIMNFTMWALVAAFPCQESNGLPAQLRIAKHLDWAQPIMLVQEEIGKEWKKKDKNFNGGSLEESQRLEKVAAFLAESDFRDDDETAAKVAELAAICRKMDEGLGALGQQVREVFHRLAKSRIEVLNHVDQISP
ncbi:hypothetical protein AgCh_007113 [Apium graveolens]